MRVKRIVGIVLIAIGLAGIGALVIVGNKTRNDSPLRGIHVTIDYQRGDHLVMEQEIEQRLRKQMPELKEMIVREVNRREIADSVASSPYIESAEVSVSMGCVLIVRAVQRRPIVRMFRGDEEYYMDKHGKSVPLSKHGESDVVVASGTLARGKAAESAWRVAKYLDEHPAYWCLIDQIYRDEKGELLLVPKVGDQIIVIGDTSRLDEKMANLLRFYRKAQSLAGWDRYSTINLKYRGQVICTKREQ